MEIIHLKSWMEREWGRGGGTRIHQVEPLARNIFVSSANENPIQGPITITHKCLIHKEKNKFDLNWKEILPSSTAVSRQSQINSEFASLNFHKFPVQFLKHSFI